MASHMNNCTYCGRENTANVAQCRECGTPFGTEPTDLRPSESDGPGNPQRTAAEERMLSGALWCVGGILVTVLSFVSAASNPLGGTYLVAWGAIVFGALRFFQGRTDRDAKPSSETVTYEPSSEDVAYEALSDGTKLEIEGRVEEAMLAYKEVIEKYPDTEAGKDAKKSIESLQSKLG
jgi:hypothetical protein